MPKFFNTTSDRRQYPRTKLSEIAYIGMGPENGGLVLDVSDGGLSFHSVAPVQQSETIRFLLSLHGHSRIEGYGEVVWTNEMKTVCGLRFTSLSSGAREHLDNWTNQSKMPSASRQAPVSTAAPDPSEIEESTLAAADQAEALRHSVFAIPPAEQVFLSAPEGSSFWQTRLMFGSLVSVLGVALSVGAFFYGIHVGKLQTGSLASPASELVAASPSSTLTPAAVADSEKTPPQQSSPTVEASADANSTAASEIPHASALPNVEASHQAVASSIANAPSAAPGISPASAAKPESPAADKLRRSASDALAQQESGKLQLAAALAYLNGDGGQRDSAKAVQELWAAIRNGNAQAEVILSDLYLTGDGVAKSCEQARVLLKAATQTGSSGAQVKLDELDSNGCQ